MTAEQIAKAIDTIRRGWADRRWNDPEAKIDMTRAFTEAMQDAEERDVWAAIAQIGRDQPDKQPTPLQFAGMIRTMVDARLSNERGLQMVKDLVSRGIVNTLTPIYDRPCTACAEAPVYLDRLQHQIVCRKCNSVRVIGRTTTGAPRTKLTDAEYGQICREFGEEEHGELLDVYEAIRRGIDVGETIPRHIAATRPERARELGLDVETLTQSLAETMDLNKAIEGVPDPGPGRRGRKGWRRG